MQAFSGLVEEKIQTEDSVMEGVAMRTIDTEDMRTTGSFLEDIACGDGRLRPLRAPRSRVYPRPLLDPLSSACRDRSRGRGRPRCSVHGG